ncbi:UNVERIFIED_CONTAM: hypothetical protein FKN15_031256 [Acipenser sinensis]
MTLEAIRYRAGSLQILNQLLLPHQSVFENIKTVQDGWEAIRSMKVRGAPAIAIVGCLSLAVELQGGPQREGEELVAFVRESLEHLVTARPTAVNLGKAAAELTEYTEQRSQEPECTAERLQESVIGWIEAMLERDVSDNRKIGNFGAQHILSGVSKEQVRGAPAIAIVGCLSLAVELQGGPQREGEELVAFVRESLEHLVTARPTAVNLGKAAAELTEYTEQRSQEPECTAERLQESVIGWIEAMLERDVSDNRKIGNFGAQHILSGVSKEQVTILTHCNTGSLATAGYGTALGVVRSLHAMGRLAHVFCTETPVVVGADRVVANGDTANKVGTYQLAIVAKHHGIPFYVAAPSTSCDLSLESGREIVIEERPAQELSDINGERIAAPGINVWNPAFDVTPHDLITGGIITELGVFLPSELQAALTGRLTAL